jgi:asparagine synthase (glutamine-hydrolysing)
MCGIAGFSGTFEPSLLEGMSRRVAHRGPDDAGIYFDEMSKLGLAHRRLSIIDLSAFGHQPLWDSTRQAVIVFNGEIYNYRELRRELIASGHMFNGHSDTEVLVNLYLSDGPAMLTRLNGIYAFAIWDVREQTLFLARDGLGVKPLYFAETPKGFLFASELKALLEEPSLDRTLDQEAIRHYLTYLWAPAPRTMLRAAKKLEPGNALLVRNGRLVRQWRYYDLPYNQPVQPLSVADAAAAVAESVRTAVARQMVSDVPVGAFLSGGLDSSAIAAFARDLTGNGRLQCFTIGFHDTAARRDGIVEDLPYARRVASHLGVDLHTVYVGPEMIERLEQMIYHLDEPQADPASLHVLYISQLARDHGIKVLLSGAGGDDIFTGYRRHVALSQERFWTWLPAWTRRTLAGMVRHAPTGHVLARRFRRAFEYAGLENDARLASYFYWTAPQTVRALCTQAAPEGALEPMLASLGVLPRDTHPLNRMLYLEGRHFLADHNLNYTDKMSMAAGVEVRVPLLDRELVALAARLPVGLKQYGHVSKWIFKKAMEPYLPREVIYRPKTGFGVPLRRWLRQELKPLVTDVLSDASLRRRGLFDPAYTRSLVEADMAGRLDATYTIFSMICIELWCRVFLDAKDAGFGNR